MLSRGLKLLKATKIEKNLSVFHVTKINFAEHKEVSTKVEQEKKRKDIVQYVEGQIVTRNQLTLKKDEDIENFVLKTIKNYFRTTNKNGLNPESLLIDHGLDSLDSIEISMQIEEDLGYVISAETLPVLNKVKHYINYIKQVESFKQEYKRAPLS